MSLNFAQLQHLPSVQSILGGVYQATGMQTAADLLEKAQALLREGALNAEAVHGFNGELQVFVGAFGSLIPGGPLSRLAELVAKYDADLQAIAAGQSIQVAEIQTEIGGVKYDLVLSISAKPAVAAPVTEVPAA